MGMGGLLGFINSICQIGFDVFERPDLMAWVFAGIAGPMALSSWLNSRIVERIGSRRIMLRALGAFTFFAALHLALAAFHGETLLVFILLQALPMPSFGLLSAHPGAIALEPLGPPGSASCRD